MIEINLLPGKKKKASAGGAGFKLALPDFRGLLASIKNPWLLVASATSLVVVGGGKRSVRISISHRGGASPSGQRQPAMSAKPDNELAPARPLTNPHS